MAGVVAVATLVVLACRLSGDAEPVGDLWPSDALIDGMIDERREFRFCLVPRVPGVLDLLKHLGADWRGTHCAGIARFHELAAAHAGEPGELVVGIETDRGLFVAALVAAGYQVFAVNPMSASRYRDRHRSSGAKSDPGDAKVLADLVRTDRPG